MEDSFTGIKEFQGLPIPGSSLLSPLVLVSLSHSLIAIRLLSAPLHVKPQQASIWTFRPKCGVCYCGRRLGSPGSHICPSHFAVSIRSRLAGIRPLKLKHLFWCFLFKELENVCFS